MRKRKALPPDTRPRWDDPDLLCLYTYGGWGISAQQNQSNAIYGLIFSPSPHWSEDPSYNWAEQAKKKRL